MPCIWMHKNVVRRYIWSPLAKSDRNPRLLLGFWLREIETSNGQRVAIYRRVSTDDQGCERQERDLRAFAECAGHEVVGVFMEKASGVGPSPA